MGFPAMGGCWSEFHRKKPRNTATISRRAPLTARSFDFIRYNQVYLMPNVTVIVPARNEEANIEACLRSLLGATHEIDARIVVADDSSTDHTAHIAQRIDGVCVLRVPTLPAGWVGKNHALAY